MKNDQLYNKQLPTRIDKALAWLADSRNKWREKCKETKLQLKRKTLAIKRLKDSRDDWRLENIQLKQELIKSKQKISSLQYRVDELESQIEDRIREIQSVKKKQ